MMQNVSAQGYMPIPQANAVNTQVTNPQVLPQAPMPAAQNPIYNYPNASMYTQPYSNQYGQYMPQTSAAPSVNAVNIQIFEPKAYGTPAQAAPAQNYGTMPAQFMPTMTPFPQMQQAEMPAMISFPQQPNMQPQQIPTYTPAPQVQEMPAAVVAPVQQPQAQTVQQEAPSVTVVPPAQQTTPQVDVNAIVSALQGTDTAAQEDAITKIANLSQGDPAMKAAVLSEPVMMGLVNIIKQDTSGLQGPTEAQVAAINKAAAGEKLTPEEQALTEKLAPKTAADKNRVIAMFTLAMLQKNQRDEIDAYNQTQPAESQVPQIKINDLIGFNEIEKAARDEKEKDVKLAAIQALSYVARPEDKESLEVVLKSALQDPEPFIQSAATEALNMIGSTAAQEQVAPAEPKKLSKKEQKAMAKAEKAAAKQAETEAKKAKKAA